MSELIYTKNYEVDNVNKREVLRYMGCKNSDNETDRLLDDCLNELAGKLKYKTVYGIFDVNITGEECSFLRFSVKSKDLAKNLDGCKRVIIFAATVGFEIDRLISKYSQISPSKALMFQSIGAERMEALCDLLCSDVSNQLGVRLKNRFSSGYGDLPLSSQNDIFRVLDCTKKIGVSLNNSLLMSPTKSVTAFVGITDEKII